MSKGFMNLGRELLDYEDYFSERFTRASALVDLCFLAAFKDMTFRIRGVQVEQKAGQVAKSVRELAVRWQWSVNTVTKYLNELQKSGIIEIQKTSVNQLITIKKYITVNTQNDTQIETQTETQTDTQNDTQNDTSRIIENKDKEIERLKKELTNVSKKKKSSELDLSVVAPEYLEFVETWLQYKKERGESYKPSGFSVFYKKLLELSNNNTEKAKKIIEQSMANNWAGIFKLKQMETSLPLGFIQTENNPDKYKNSEW